MAKYHGVTPPYTEQGVIHMFLVCPSQNAGRLFAHARNISFFSVKRIVHGVGRMRKNILTKNTDQFATSLVGIQHSFAYFNHG